MPEDNVGCSPLSLTTVFFEIRVFYWNHSSPIWLANSIHLPCTLSAPFPGFIAGLQTPAAVLALIWVLGVGSQVLKLAQKAPCQLSHLPGAGFSLLLSSSLLLLLLLVVVGGDGGDGVYVRGITCRDQFSPPTMWVPGGGTEVLVANAFTFLAISPPWF